MSRSRRKDRIKGPKGWLYPYILHILEKDEHGRPRLMRLYFDDDKLSLGELAGPEKKKLEFLTVFTVDLEKPKAPENAPVAEPPEDPEP